MKNSTAWSAARLYAKGERLVDKQGRQILLHGINLIHKGNLLDDNSYNFYPDWPQDIYRQFADMGFSLVRLGILWAALEPAPGRYDEAYFAFVSRQLDLAAEAGIAIILDMHQDLYAQRYSDGAPDWAVLTDLPFQATQLWSDAYLFSPAVQACWDAFWDNRLVPQSGQGLQDHLAALWREIARRFHGHPALLGADILNEPAPGSEIQQIFGGLLHAFGQLMKPQEAQALGLKAGDMEALTAIFMDPEKKLMALEMLNDPLRYRQLGEMCQAPVQLFEREKVAPFYQRVRDAIRQVNEDIYILRGNNYMSNIGIPSGITLIQGAQGPDPRQLFAPHGYDLTVDTPAIDLSSDSRAHSIFTRHRETQQRLNIPVIVGEWGAFSKSPAALSHGQFLMNLFGSWGWGSTYWCYEGDMAGMPAQQLLRRSRPLALCGHITRQHYDGARNSLALSWQEGPDMAGCVNEIYLHEAPLSATLDDYPLPLPQAGPRLTIPWAGGARHLRLQFPSPAGAPG